MNAPSSPIGSVALGKIPTTLPERLFWEYLSTACRSGSTLEVGVDVLRCDFNHWWEMKHSMNPQNYPPSDDLGRESFRLLWDELQITGVIEGNNSSRSYFQGFCPLSKISVRTSLNEEIYGSTPSDNYVSPEEEKREQTTNLSAYIRTRKGKYMGKFNISHKIWRQVGKYLDCFKEVLMKRGGIYVSWQETIPPMWQRFTTFLEEDYRVRLVEIAHIMSNVTTYRSNQENILHRLEQELTSPSYMSLAASVENKITVLERYLNDRDIGEINNLREFLNREISHLRQSLIHRIKPLEDEVKQIEQQIEQQLDQAVSQCETIIKKRPHVCPQTTDYLRILWIKLGTEINPAPSMPQWLLDAPGVNGIPRSVEDIKVDENSEVSREVLAGPPIRRVTPVIGPTLKMVSPSAPLPQPKLKLVQASFPI